MLIRRKNMKMIKRIFIALLIVALFASSFAAFAAEEETTVSLGYEKILEYFEEQSLVDYDFSSDVDYSAAFLANRPANRANQIIDALVEDASIPGGKYLSVSILDRSGRNAYTDNHAYFAWTSADAIDDFNVDMTVSGTKKADATQEQNLPKIIIAVGTNQFTDMSTAKTNARTIAAIDYRSGYFTYLKAGVDGATEFKTDYKIEAGEWYNVSLTYDVDNGVSITVYNCNDMSNSITVTDGYVPYAEVRDIRIGAHGDDNGTARGSVMKFADVKLLGGVYHREVSDMQADIEANVLEMYNLFNSEDVSIEQKIEYCEIVKKVKEYGFTTADASVQKALDELGTGAFGLYNSKIEIFVNTVDTLATYAEKKAYADETLVFVNALKEIDLNGASDEVVAATAKNLADFEAASRKLANLEEQSIKFVTVINSVLDHNLDDYAVVKADLELLEGCEPDLTYEGVADAYRHYTKLVDAENTIRTSAELFIEAVNVANDTTLDFNSRAVAYSRAEDNYFDNVTYPGVAEAVATFTDVLLPYMQLEISNAENFIKYVNKADYAIYISAKQENLDIAKTYMDICQPGFAGVAEAKLLYVEVENFIAEQRANAKAYIDAVNALDSLTGSALTNGIKTAESLQAAGNVLGVDGVTEANIKLNQLIASIELRDRYCIHFINLVNSLDKATDAANTFAILADAKEAEVKADKSYAGVSEASVKLEKAIADFNAQVNAINAEFEKANNVAANTCGVGANESTVSGHVIALVKKFFDEE